MCLAIYKPAGNPIELDNLKRGWEANDDGAGYCFVDEHGEIVIKKFMTWDEFLTEYQPDIDAYGDESPFLIHFRITSKGSTCIDNCHPFRVNDDMAIIHNGTITNIDIDKLDKRSDTKIFAEEYLRNIGETLLDNIYVFQIAEGFVGYSKVCILHRKRGVFILNEEMGHWNKEDGCWYSNHSYEPKKYTAPIYYNSYKENSYNPYTPTKKDIVVYDATKKTWSSDAYFDAIEVATCDYCHKDYAEDTMVTVTDSFGRTVELCELCLQDWAELNDGEICTDCGVTAETEQYWNELLEEVIPLCQCCKNAWDMQGYILTLIEGKR